MKRRDALRTLGAFVAVVGGTRRMVMAEDNVASEIDRLSLIGVGDVVSLDRLADYVFSEDGLRNVIIRRKDGSEIVVPFSEIFDALKKD